MKRKHVLGAVSLALMVVLLITAINVDNQNRLYSESQFEMDTVMSYKLCGKNAEKTIDELKEYVSELDKKLSLYNEDSEVFKINQNAGKDFVKVSGETFEILSLSKELSKESGGALDLTVAPLTRLWGVNSDSAKVPTDEEIEIAKKLVDCDSLILDNQTMSVKLEIEGQAIDLGGFAKGYVCDKAVEICKKNNVKKGVIAIGGNVAIIGEKTSVSIRTPEKNSSGYFMSVEIKDEIIATSGGYERYFEENGKTYEHIIDPITGYTAQSDLLSVTVISKNGILTDALSTQLYVQGLDEVKSLLGETDFGIIAVDKNKAVYVSHHLKDTVKLTESFSDYHFAE